MGSTLRPGRSDDAVPCGKICFDAFTKISNEHNFPPDFPSPEVASGLLSWMLTNPSFYSVIAEENGRIVGSNFLDLRNPVAGVGPITVDPKTQNKSVGRSLMEDVQRHAREKGFDRVRLVQAAFHTRSMSLYTKLGFDIREPLACIQGKPTGANPAGRKIRPAQQSDLEGCNWLCSKIHGHDRGGELRDAIAGGTATVVERDGRISGYATIVGFFGHAVGEDSMDIAALIHSAKEFAGPGFLLPSRNGELFRWCLDQGLRVVQPLSLMSQGPYQEPKGAFLPSILY